MSGRRQKGFGVRAALLVVVMVPLLGLCASAASAVRSSNNATAAADRVRDSGSEVSQLTSLQAALYSEHFWAGAVEAVARLGSTSAEMAPILGHDVAAEVAAAKEAVDLQRGALAVPGFEAILTQARLEGATPSGARGRYGRAEDLLDGQIRVRLDQLAESTGAVDGVSGLAHASSTLSTAVEVRRQAFLVTANLFGVRFRDQAINADPGAALIAARSAFGDAWVRLRTLVGSDPRLGEVLDAVQLDPRTVAFFDSVESTIAQDRAAPGSVTLGSATAVSDFTDALVVLENYVAVVTGASDEVVATGDGVADDAAEDRRMSLIEVAGAILLTIVTVGVVGRWMVVSVDGLASSAIAMNEGDLDRPAPVKGPREVRAAAKAMNDAAANLRSAERQALALARDDLGAPTVPDPEPGQLGSSMQEAMASLATSWQEREEHRRQLQHDAMHDGLTGLPNRTSIVAALEAALAARRGRPDRVAVLFIDLDGFKQVNDQHGHAAGDLVLCAIAGRILSSVRAIDVVGRLGGDEFVVVADPVGSADEARALAGRIRDSIRQPIAIGSASVTPAVSIGVALSANETTGPAQLLHDADLAVYEAKAVGTASIEVCTPELRRAADERQAVEAALRDAIDRNGLRVHYQPVVSAPDMRVHAVEALVRWPDGDGPDRPAAEFVGIAERSDLVVRLDQWVIEHTIEQLADPDGPLGNPGVSAAVNVSARHASTTPFASSVLAMLARHGVAPQRLMVELTESALLDDVDHVVAELRTLREHGVSVAIDDFGTGYTSLALLHRLPIDTLKLDLALTSELETPEVGAIVKLIVDTSHVLGLTVIAEGVETDEQARGLVALGVDQLQGYWFGRPEPLDALPHLEGGPLRPPALEPT